MDWVKASASGTGNCVELRTSAGGVLVRDSKDPGGGVLSLGRGAWLALVAAARGGRLDGLGDR